MKKHPAFIVAVLLLIGLAVFFLREAPAEKKPPQPPAQAHQEAAAPVANPVPATAEASDEDLSSATRSDAAPALLLPSEAVAKVLPNVDLEVLAIRLPAEEFAKFRRMREEFPKVDWTEIEATHQAFLDKRAEFPLNLDAPQREAYAAWISEVEPISKKLIRLRGEALGLSIAGTENGRRYVLDGFQNGSPVYVYATNATAATTTGVSFVRWNPGFDPALGDGINGGEIYINVNDYDIIFEHAEFQLPNNGGSRILLKEIPSYAGADSFHTTHVAGTMAAWGYNPDLQGMAPRAWIRALVQQTIGHITTYGMATPGQQMAEINPRTGNPQLRSVVGNTSLGGSKINRYNTMSASFDVVLRDYPYYMHFFAAGNAAANGNYFYIVKLIIDNFPHYLHIFGAPQTKAEH